MRLPHILVVSLFLITFLGGCLFADEDLDPADPTEGAPSLDYLPEDPDADLDLVETEHLLEGAGVEIHVRVKRPAGDGPFPVIAQFTPYTAPGTNPVANNLMEPLVDCTGIPPGSTGLPSVTSVNCDGGFDWNFVKRGYAFAYGDVRGTGDSSGCLDLRGENDIADLYEFTEWLGTREWSNGNVGFIGASYPGSEAHMAGIAGAPHLKAIVPIVASTSFYHYHHNDGVPYSGQHSLGGTNTGYTTNAITPTVNPQNTNYLTRYIEEAQCGYDENMLDHGGLDQSGAYYDWWQERNLRPSAGEVDVPVLMAQGLADWNVKPDHIADWFNDLQLESKVLIAGQWGHAWPYSPCAEEEGSSCDSRVPYGQWWQYVSAFFDTYLKEIDTGMFESSHAWVQDSLGQWHRSDDWPLREEDREQKVFHFQADGTLTADPAHEVAERGWYGCPDDQGTYGHSDLQMLMSVVEGECEPEGAEEIVFETGAFDEDVIISGVPLVNLTLESRSDVTHLVVLVEVLDAQGSVVNREVRPDSKLGERENYGYLNPAYRYGLDNPKAIEPDEPYSVSIDLYPQEDVVQAGERLRVTLRSDDEGRTVEAYEPGKNTVLFGPGNENHLWLPLRPADLQGTRLPDAAQ